MLWRMLALLLVLMLGAVAAYESEWARAVRSSWDDPIAQWEKIKFSHKKHVGELGSECSACHAVAATSEKAADLMLPKHAECSGCHTEVESEDPAACQYCHTDAENPEAFAAPLRDNIIFSHKAHIENQKLECSACHAGIEESEKPTLAFLPTMASCNTCHNDAKASNACESCHPKAEILIPLTHRQADWAKEHKRLVRADIASNDCAVCHSENFCQTCHAEVTTQLTRGEWERSVSEHRPMPSGKNPLVKQKVHELNYVFVHSMDSRSRKSDCYSCHDQQTFCTDCHARNQEAGFASPFPLSHRAADFVRLGPGSEGGQHAVLARRDIESCASCHDVEGRDPACVLCHANLAPGRR